MKLAYIQNPVSHLFLLQFCYTIGTYLLCSFDLSTFSFKRNCGIKYVKTFFKLFHIKHFLSGKMSLFVGFGILKQFSSQDQSSFVSSVAQFSKTVIAKKLNICSCIVFVGFGILKQFPLLYNDFYLSVSYLACTISVPLNLQVA